MINQNLYKIIIADPGGSIAGVLVDYESISFGEKINGFVNCNLEMNGNRLLAWQNKALRTGCTIFIQRKINGTFRNVWAGKMPKEKDWSVDTNNIRNQSLIFDHLGKDFVENLPIRYSGGGDESQTMKNMVEFVQTPANYLGLSKPVSLSADECNYFIVPGLIQNAGRSTFFDFSKETSLATALDQVANTGLVQKQYIITPTIRHNTPRQFLVFVNRNTGAAAHYKGRSGTGLTNHLRYTIKDIKTSSDGFKNLLLLYGSDTLKTAVRSPSSSNIMLSQKVRYTDLGQKNVASAAALTALGERELQKFQNPTKLVNIELMENDEQFGKYGAGDTVRIQWTNQDDIFKNVDNIFRVYEINVSYDKLGFEKVSLKVALQDPIQMENGVGKLINYVKKSDKNINILNQ